MNVLRASKIENAPCEEQAKFVQERLLETEEWLYKMNSAFAFYTKKSLRLRDATDGLSIVLNDFATKERINRSIKNQVLLFADLVATLGDIRDCKVQKMQSSVLNEFCKYNEEFRQTKAQVKSILSAKQKETNKRKQLGKIRTVSPCNRYHIMKAEAGLSTAVSKVSQAQRELEESALQFEKKKIEDIKNILSQFVLAELSESAKSIEVLTQACRLINSINVKSDLEDFSGLLKTNPMTSRLLTVKNTCKKEDVKTHIQPDSSSLQHSNTSSNTLETESKSEENELSDTFEKCSVSSSDGTTVQSTHYEN